MPADAADAESPPAAAAGPASDFAETTENVDVSAKRRAAVDDALTRLGAQRAGVVIVGDGHQFGSVFGGDNVGPGDRSGPILEAVAGRTVADLERVFVAPGGFDELRRPLADHRVVLLGSRARWGATALAIRLLAATGLRALHRVRFTGPLAELPLAGLPPGGGFILEATGPRALASLRSQHLDDLRDQLATADSRLVIVTDADQAGQYGGLPAWRTLAAPPDAYEVVLRHLRHRADDPEQAVTLIAEAFPGTELTAMPPGAFDIHRLVELACDLAEAARGHGTVAEAAERFVAGADRAVETWLDEDVTDPGDLALVLALAVLNGLPYEAVARASRLLERRWAAEETAAPPGGRARRSRRARLRSARARLTTEQQSTRYGPAPLEVASFIDDTYPPRILRHYWHEHDYDQELLLDWLREVAGDVEVRVATHAAIAVGYLGTFAFDTVRRDVITPWAGGGRGDERELAVAALHLPARAPDTAARVIAMVRDWAGRPGAAARMTAARALGGSVGAVLGEGPDKYLTRLAKGADTALSTALGDSIAELMADAAPDRELTLLRLLDAWSAEGRNGCQLAGVLGFLQLAWTLWEEVGDVSWPRLLWLAEGDEPAGPARELIVALWSRALVAPGADNRVRIVLGTWAERAERRPELRSPFVRLMRDVARGGRQARLLTAHAVSLRTRRPATPDTARKLLDALTEGAVRHG